MIKLQVMSLASHKGEGIGMLDRFLVNLKKQKSCNMQNICISKQMVSKQFKI
jgi:hypothetical protein